MIVALRPVFLFSEPPMLSALFLAAALAVPQEGPSFVDKLPPDITVKSWLNTPGWRSVDDLLGRVYLIEFWATW
jgi:hypothetical protein